ncbi:phage portal protein [Mycobacterium sp. TY815]|uniref:phage portal protein n=1 Tax=Mycobacterium sp. TY815 TaxID=3050581 RepID=UPI0027409935|nr:phage portal protein [Mycobacterium sp. TY815]MDP7706809.1 phage portal protein [Mycobacterium sp. TY815]
MTFVVSEGAVRALSRPSFVSSSRLPTVVSLSMDYDKIWRTQPAVRTVVTFLARNIAQLGLPLYRRDSDTERERLNDHPLAMLLRQPNPWTTRYRFINALVHDFAIYDVAYWLKMKVDGQTSGLVRLPPKLVAPKGDNWLTPDEFELAGSKQRKVFPADQVVYFRGYSADGDVGVSPLESLRQILLEDWAGSQMREQVMRNGARVSGYIKRPPPSTSGVKEWSREARERFRQQWQQQYVADGPQAGGTPILEDGMEFVAASQTAKELQYVEGRKLTRGEVASAYFIPPPMVGILDDATFSNITEQRKMLYTDALGPWLTMIQDEISLQLIPDFEGKPQQFYAEFNLREKLSGDFVSRQDAITKAVGGPTMTINEARALDNRPPVEGGDELIRPLNVTQNGDQQPILAEGGGGNDVKPTNKPPEPDDEQED